MNRYYELLLKMNMKKYSLKPYFVLAAMAVLASQSVQAQSIVEKEFPTLARVEYVMECMRQYPNISQREMVYKCSCAIDSIAKEITYDEYVDFSTISNSISIAGERGAAIREQKSMRPIANKFRDLQAKAKKACFIND
jgi:hypothetical protein